MTPSERLIKQALEKRALSPFLRLSAGVRGVGRAIDLGAQTLRKLRGGDFHGAADLAHATLRRGTQGVSALKSVGSDLTSAAQRSPLRKAVEAVQARAASAPAPVRAIATRAQEGGAAAEFWARRGRGSAGSALAAEAPGRFGGAGIADLQKRYQGR